MCKTITTPFLQLNFDLWFEVQLWFVVEGVHPYIWEVYVHLASLFIVEEVQTSDKL